MARAKKQLVRCHWAATNPLHQKYHDEEWGVPVHDDRKLFEFLILETAQAGLSWILILRKRENYRKAFAHFDPRKVAKFAEDQVDRLMRDAGIVRNEAKIRAAINNAQRFLEVQKEFGSFANYIWAFVGHQTQRNEPKQPADIPVQSETSAAIAKDMKKRGFKFLGPIVMYSHMQATGMVDDHLVTCHRAQGGRR